MKIQYNLLIALACLGYMGCSKKNIASCPPDEKVDKSEWCMHDPNYSCPGYEESCSEKIFHSYRPILIRNPTGDPNGKIEIMLRPCPNGARFLLENLTDESFVFVDYNNTMFAGATIANSRNLMIANVKDLKKSKDNSSYSYSKYNTDEEGLWSIYNYQVHPLYAEYIEYARKWDSDPANFAERAIKGYCYSNFKCLPQSMLDKSNCGTLTGTRSFIGCPSVSSPIPVNKLPNFTQENYNNDKILYPVLHGGDGSYAYPAPNYVLDASKDVVSTGGVSKSYRDVYVNVVLANNSTSKLGVKIDFNHRYRVGIKGPGATDTTFVNLDGKSSPNIRGCRNERDTLQYMIKMNINKAGQYTLRLFDLDISEPLNCTPISGFKCVAENTFKVTSTDNYSQTKVSDFSRREINLIVLDFGIVDLKTGIVLTTIDKCKIKAWPSLKETLEDAFSLNEKQSITPKNTAIQKGIGVTVFPSKAAPVSMNSEGNFKLQISILERFRQRGQGEKESYNTYLNEILFGLYEGINGSLPFNSQLSILNAEDLTKIIALYANAMILVDDLGVEMAAKEGDEAVGKPELGSPNEYFFANNNLVLGFSGPNEFPADYVGNKREYMRLMNVACLFKKSIKTHAANRGLTEESAVAITLAHELGHVWAQKLMVSESTDGAKAHQDYCGGYNEKNCVFRYDNYETHKILDTYGIVFCESHRQILFNQLFRKFYSQSSSR